MDISGKDGNVEARMGGDEPVNYQQSNMSSDWQVNGNNLTNGSIGMIPISDSIGELSARSSAPMVDSFSLLNWDRNSNVQNLGYCDVNAQNGASTSSSLGPLRPDMGWTPNVIFRGGMLLPTAPSLPHLPVDSAFIERAARFSCFGGGNLGEMMNSFSVHDPLAPYSRGLGMIPGPHQGNEMKLQTEALSQQHEMNVTDVTKEALLSVPYENEKKSLQRGSDEAEFSGCHAQEEPKSPAGESPPKGLDFKKRKRGEQDSEQIENNDTPQPSIDTAKNTVDVKQKGDQNKASISKPSGKNGKQGSQGLDLPKEEYIHIRARRGQATNSHSLAERVRREKISERMKFLQDLVPGCSKVTGKAVMLDEIINYVQSLQRQVEFLSMKLATVNPQLEFNIESLLSKDPRAGLSSPSLVSLPDMTVPFSLLHPAQPGLIPIDLLNSLEPLQRPVNLQSTPISGGFKEPTGHVPSIWEDEFHNIVHMGFDTSAPLNSQDLSSSLPTGGMKAEP